MNNMYVLLAIFNDVFKTYLDSLKRDLGGEGFKMILILTLLAWAGIAIVLWLAISGGFQMPTDPLFYLFWFALTLLTEISFTLFLLGMLNTSFFAASSLGVISSAVTAVYAALFLGERYLPIQIAAVCISAIGSVLFLRREGLTNHVHNNKGVILVLLSVLLTPLELIFYKAATLHTASYQQFLTGRLVMDLTFYTFFFVIVSTFWFRNNPFPHITSLVDSRVGVTFLVGTTIMELLDSWLIFKIPISLFTILGTLSVPTAYFIGVNKYGEKENLRNICGSILIVVGVVMFLLK